MITVITIAIDLLGGFDVRAANGESLGLPTQKYRALLAYLAMPPGRAHSREALVALLWPELPHEQARAALRQALWALRRTLTRNGASALVQEGDTVALDAGAVAVDVAEFTRAAAGDGVDDLARAASLYRGPLLAGLAAREAPFEEWLAVERERLVELALGALGRLLARQCASARASDAVQTALRILALDPLQEAVHRTLMELYVQLGRRSAALRQYQTCVATLQRELGVEPDPRTRALYQGVLRDRTPDTAVAVTPNASPPPPETPLVGREHEVAVLREMLRALATKRGRVAVIVGDAGIGKSRLAAELIAEASRAGARVMTGRSYESDRVLPLAPWAEALRSTRLDGEREILAALPAACLAQIGRFFPRLHAAQATPPGPGDDLQLFETIVTLVSAMAARAPVVIALEDVHWADDMSLRLTSFLARRLDGLPVLLVLTARAGEIETGTSLDRILAEAPRTLPVQQLTLAPLAEEATVSLVRALSGGRDDTALESLGQRIWQASEGHPFMVVEMVRAVGETTGTDSPATVALPQRVRRLIEHRLQELGPDARSLAGTAAAIGREFPYALVQQASGMSEDDAVSALEELVRRRIVHAVGERFDFTHERLREVAYALLLAPRRKLLHRRIAEALEHLPGDDVSERHAALGAHYAEAEAWDRSARHLYEAAKVARDRSAYREGVVLLERALEALAHLPRTRETVLLEIDIRLRLFRCLNPLSEPRAAEQVARARALVAEHPDDARETIVLVEVAELSRFARDTAAAIEAGDRALVLAARSGQPRLAAQAHFQVGVAHLTRGAYDLGIAHLRSTVADLTAAPLPDRLGYPYVVALTRLTWAHTDRGELDVAARYADDAARIGRQTDEVLAIGEAAMALGVLRLVEGAPAEAIAALDRALGLARARQLPYMQALSAPWLALAYARSGHARDALLLLDECERDRVWERVRLQWSRIVVRLAETALLLGDGGRAQALAQHARTLARATGEPAGEAEAVALLAEVARWREPAAVTEAKRLASESAAIARRLGLQPLVMRLQPLLT